MPRKRRQTMSGAPAQPIGAIPGQIYGAGVDQMALQRAMPAPNLAGGGAAPVAPAPPPASPAAAQAVPGPGAAPNYDDLLRNAASLREQTGLLPMPTNRPNEPITAGLTRGPGPGPEALGMRRSTPVGDAWRRISAATGDPYFAQLVDRLGA